MKKINVKQTLNEFLATTLASAKKDKQRTLIMFCNTLLRSKNNILQKTLAEVFKTDFSEFPVIRGIARGGYVAFCEAFKDTTINMKDWQFFQDYLLVEEIKKSKTSMLVPVPLKKVQPKVGLKKVKVPTDPVTHVYTLEVRAKGYGVWPETFNTPREVAAFLKGLEVMASFLGVTGVILPSVPTGE